MRAYVVPANPNTLAQQAHRAAMAEAVFNGQGTFGTPANVTEWNRVALPDLISGFNLFVKDSVGTPVLPDSYSAALITKITGYNTTIPANEMRFFVFRAGNWITHTPSVVGGTPPAYEILIANLAPAYVPAAADLIAIADNRVFPDSAVQAEMAAKATSGGIADETTGTYVRALLVA
jgi:hypothetical protein